MPNSKSILNYVSKKVDGNGWYYSYHEQDGCLVILAGAYEDTYEEIKKYLIERGFRIYYDSFINETINVMISLDIID